MTEYNQPIERFLDLAAILLQTEAEKEAPRSNKNPFDNKRGNQDLARDIQVFPTRRKGERVVGNSSIIKYAKFVYYGTKPHVILPKKKKALKTPYGTFKKVNHPGTKANPYLDRGLKNMVSSGKLQNLLDGFADEMSEEMFSNISDGFKNIKVG